VRYYKPFYRQNNSRATPALDSKAGVALSDNRQKGDPKEFSVKRPTHTSLKQVQHLHAVLPRLMGRVGLCETVQAVMTRMEQAYDEIAGHYGFICRGCEESCCRTLFYHHTYAEFMLLEGGLQSLSKRALEGVLERAAAVERRLAKDRERGAAEPQRAMCPLNQAGRCLLYAHRPMICRLHGIPHTLQRPDGHTIGSPGCHRFDALESDAIGGTESPRRLNRTPHYQRLAQVEKQLRSRIEAPMRLNMTLAEWLAARACCWGDGARSAERSLTTKDPSP
jgi:Fe-S-cluster containining protein